MSTGSLKAENIVKDDWSISSSEKYYGLKNWGKGYFQINKDGYLKVLPLLDSKGIRIFDIVQEAKNKGYDLPITIRIQDLLQTLGHQPKESVVVCVFKRLAILVFDLKIINDAVQRTESRRPTRRSRHH